MKSFNISLLSFLVTGLAFAFSLPEQSIRAYNCPECTNLSHTPLQKNWSIKDLPLRDNEENQQKSFSAREIVTLSQLQKGISLSTLGAGAMLQISPLNKETPTNISLFLEAKGKLMPLKEASTLFISSKNRNTSPSQNTKATMAQLDEKLGSGIFILKTHEMSQNSKAKFLISVFDKYSTVYLSVKTNQSYYQYGDTLTATVTLSDDDIDYPIETINTTLVKPTGEKEPLVLTQTGENEYQATITLNDPNSFAGGNGYIETEISSVVDMQKIKRNAHCAFSYAIPSAAITDIEKIAPDTLDFKAQVNVASDSRYAMTAVLYQIDNEGQATPFQVVQSADWFTKGSNSLALHFDKPDNDKHEYAIGYLQLIDYGQMKPVFKYNDKILLTAIR